MADRIWVIKAEWTVGEDLGSDHLPIIKVICCQVPNWSVTYQRARWNTKDVNWQAFADVVDTSTAGCLPEPIALRNRALLPNRTLMFRNKMLQSPTSHHDPPQLPQQKPFFYAPPPILRPTGLERPCFTNSYPERQTA